MIKSLYVLNGGEGDYVFSVGYVFNGVEVTKIKKDEKENNHFIVYLKDGNDIDIYSNNVMTIGKW